MALDEDLVCFVDPALAEPVARLRRASGLEHRTRVVSVPLEAMPPHALVDRIAAARNRHPLRNPNPVKDSVLYTVLQWSKFAAVEQAIRENPFGATHFAWADFRLRPRRSADGVFDRPSDAVRMLAMRGFTAAELADRTRYYAYVRDLVAAGYITASTGDFAHLCRLFAAESRAALDAGHAPYEEQLLPVLCTEHPALFELYYGDFHHLLDNYRWLRGSADNLLFQLREARETGKFSHGLAVALRVLESHRRGVFECDQPTRARLLEECFFACYLAQGPSSPAAREIAALYAELASRDGDWMRRAFACVGRGVPAPARALPAQL